MNLGSWIVLALVVALLFGAVRATFFRKTKMRGGCCNVGDNHRADGKLNTPLLKEEEQAKLNSARNCNGGCQGCSCSNACSSVMLNAVLPIVKE